jgi:hypothetical protein
MAKIPAVLLALVLSACLPLLRSQDNPSPEPFSPDQLDNLLAPVALYPDPLLAQVLLAATFPDQIDEAARFCRAGANPDAIDVQPWDVSVKAIAHYTTVLYMMADRLDWTTALGQAYVNQSEDVMASVQRLRQEAQAAGNLITTPQEDVEDNGGYIDIWPADPQYLYVPEYDPTVVFFGSGGAFGGPVIGFGVALPIGAWLNVDCDWLHHRIYYHGWSDKRGWIARSRPYIHVNNVYVNKNLRNVAVNRTVVSRAVNYNNLSRYNSVHQNVAYGSRGGNAFAGGAAANNGNVNNKVIQRNMNVNDPRIDSYRGEASEPAVSARQSNSPAENRPPVSAPPRQSEPQGNAAFGGNRSNFSAHESSQRGQASRSQPVRAAPAPRSSGGGGGGGGSHGGGGGSHGGGGRH